MKAVTVKALKDELNTRTNKELVAFCLRLSKFKKENKELLTYLLFEASNETAYIETVKEEIEEQFNAINSKNYYFIKKGVRKVLSNTKKYIRYSQKTETQIELLIFFCQKLKDFFPTHSRYSMMKNLYLRQITLIEKAILKLHEDLQYDYGLELNELGTDF